MILVLVSINVVGVQEAAALNVVLAIVDFATQLLLVLLGSSSSSTLQILVDNVHWGIAPTWSNLALAVPVAMLAYTGVETVSNLAEEVPRDPRANPATGKVLRLLPTTDTPLAFDGRIGIFGRVTMDKPWRLKAVDLITGKTYWTYTLPKHPDPMQPGHGLSGRTAPVVANGIVWVDISADTSLPTIMVALDERTGKVRSTTPAPCYSGIDNGTIGIAQHRIFIPSGCGLHTYVAK